MANRLGVSAQEVKRVTIWGNHSSTQFPDVSNAVVNIEGQTKKVVAAIQDDSWLKNEFISVSLQISQICNFALFAICFV